MGVQNTLLGAAGAVAGAAGAFKGKKEKKPELKNKIKPSSVKSPSAKAAEKAKASLEEHSIAKTETKNAVEERMKKIGLKRSSVK